MKRMVPASAKDLYSVAVSASGSGGAAAKVAPKGDGPRFQEAFAAEGRDSRKPTSAQPDGRGGARAIGTSRPRAQAHEVLATKDTDAKLPTSDEIATQFLPEGDEETPLAELEEATETADPAMPDFVAASEAFHHRAEPASDRVLTSAAALETAMRGSSTLPIGTGDGGPNMHDLAPQIGTGATTVPRKPDPAQSTRSVAELVFITGQPKPASDAAKEQPGEDDC